MELATGRVGANGVTFHYLEMARGPLVLRLHGFPDNAYTYTELLPRVGAGRSAALRRSCGDTLRVNRRIVAFLQAAGGAKGR